MEKLKEIDKVRWLLLVVALISFAYGWGRFLHGTVTNLALLYFLEGSVSVFVSFMTVFWTRNWWHQNNRS